jgi:hypothetical protein
MHRFSLPHRELELRTRMEVRSDPKFFQVRFEREIRENGARVRRRVWADSVARQWD